MKSTREKPGTGSRERSRNVKQAIYQQLREQIIFQEMKPGEFLNETRLSSELGVSRTVLREILQRLIADGLLMATPGQGMNVQGIDLLKIKSAYEIRVPLEALAGRLAAERGQPAHLDMLRSLIAQGAEAAERKDYRQLARLDWEFHCVIGEMTRNDLLAVTLQRLHLPFNRLWYLTMTEHGQVGNFLHEWQEILTALEAHSVTAAERALAEHMTATPAAIRPVLLLESSR